MVNGLPLHALVVHAAVVLTPLAALLGLAYAVPRFREWVRWPLVATTVVAFVAVWVAYLSGEQLTEANVYSGDLAALVETHEERAEVLRIVVTLFALVVVVAAGVLHRREGSLRLVLGGLVAVLALATAVYVVLTGDAGAQIAWYGVKS